MASLISKSSSSVKRLTTLINSSSYSQSSSSSSVLKFPLYPCPSSQGQKKLGCPYSTAHLEDIPTEGISRPLSEILKQLNKKVPDSLVRTRSEDGFTLSYLPWHIVNRIMNLYAPEWTGEVRSITYSPDGKSVSVVYRVTLYGTDAEISRESIGTVAMDDKGYGDPVQKAEAMAFRRACARLGVGLHLYHEDML